MISSRKQADNPNNFLTQMISDNLSKQREADSTIQPLLRVPAISKVSVDVARYQALLDDKDIPDESKEAMIYALWTIIVSLVELGFSVSSLDVAHGGEERASVER